MSALPQRLSLPATTLSAGLSFSVPSLLDAVGKFIVPKKPPIAKDVRFTPQSLFVDLNNEFHFTVDVAASATSAKCSRFFSEEVDGLAQPWVGESAFCNHPWSQTPAWVAKSWLEILRGCRSVVLLMPDNRAHQSFWQELVEPFRDRPLGAVSLTTRNLKGRPHFGTPEDPLAQRKNRAKNGCTLLIFRSHLARAVPDNQLPFTFNRKAA